MKKNKERKTTLNWIWAASSLASAHSWFDLSVSAGKTTELSILQVEQVNVIERLANTLRSSLE